jgi:hypothetical protein
MQMPESLDGRLGATPAAGVELGCRRWTPQTRRERQENQAKAELEQSDDPGVLDLVVRHHSAAERDENRTRQQLTADEANRKPERLQATAADHGSSRREADGAQRGHEGVRDQL